MVWGTEDIPILRKNLSAYQVSNAVLPRSYNLQNVFADQIARDNRRYSLIKALAAVKEMGFKAHDALNDAKSTALLCKHLDMEKGLREYVRHVDYKDGCVEYFAFEDPYFDLEDVLSDDYVVTFECPICGELVWCAHWVRKNSTTMLAAGTCEDGREYLVKLKLKYSADNLVFVKRLVFEMTAELRSKYEEYCAIDAVWKKYVISA